jgi:3-deoxy-7-phosphoheptulonate synthase
MTDRVYNVNIVSETPLATPEEVKAALPLGGEAENTVYASRERIRKILDGADGGFLVIVGPCSIHDTDSALEYAHKLKALAGRVDDVLMLVMRVYFEKPRTSVGWKGFINDPDMDDSFRIDEGLRRAREFLLKLADLGLPAGTEALDPVTPQYIGDLVSWTAVGARTIESQTHREMASGLSTPVGFKNGTDGNIEVAVNALKSAQRPHHFLGITQKGVCAVFRTQGNPYGHIVLRGGARPNYDRESVALCARALEEAGLPLNIVVDCSHGNSEKDALRQPFVLSDCVGQIVAGNRSIRGFMIESNLAEGRQSPGTGGSAIDPRVSVTDSCVDWSTTEKMLVEAHNRLKQA